ncbi:response regulator transcription factor [Streptomyces sp. NPDC001435]|uniref:response regulator transcription factor n=1 Tax=Streptomyces sp. NPDC001435 TaxID=3364576 RepID=UPI0036A6F11C
MRHAEAFGCALVAGVGDGEWTALGGGFIECVEQAVGAGAQEKSCSRPGPTPSLQAPRVETLNCIEETKFSLSEMFVKTEHRIWSSHPGSSPSLDAIKNSISRDFYLIKPEMNIRVMFHHAARSNSVMQSYMCAIADLGAEIRTVSDVPGRMVLFDAKVAYLFPSHQDDRFSATLVREPAIIEYLIERYDRCWQAGRPLFEDSPGEVAAAIDDVKRSVLRLLATGSKDATIAHQLGMSVRTCRKHIAEIMGILRAESRFQAGMTAHRLGLFHEI